MLDLHTKVTTNVFPKKKMAGWLYNNHKVDRCRQYIFIWETSLLKQNHTQLKRRIYCTENLLETDYHPSMCAFILYMLMWREYKVTLPHENSKQGSEFDSINILANPYLLISQKSLYNRNMKYSKGWKGKKPNSSWNYNTNTIFFKGWYSM